MPRLICTYRRFIEIIEGYGFIMVRHGASSHRRWRAEIGGNVYVVDLAYHNIGDDIPIGTLKAMIRQCGLNKKLFIK